MIATRSRTATTTAPIGMGVNLNDRPFVDINEEQIQRTIENWDLAADGQNLFVARLVHEQTTGGLFIPEEAQHKQNDAVVISAGPMAYVNDVHPQNDEERERNQMAHQDDLDCYTRRFLKPGDRVTFGDWSGSLVERRNTVKAGLQRLMVVRADQVVGVPREKK